MKLITVLFLMLLQSFCYAQNLPSPYQLDTKKSKILWNVDKNMMGGHSGYILFTWGSLQYSKKGEPLNGLFYIDMNMIRSTDNKLEAGRQKTDAGLRSPKFFSSDQYPTATVDVKQIKRIGNSSNYYVRADLTIKGISNPIDFVARIDTKPNSVFITANISINHSLWKINEPVQPNKPELVPQLKKTVAPDIHVSLDLVLTR